MKWSGGVAVAFSMLLLGGCAPTVQVTELGGAFPQREGLDQVALFSTRTPECPYQEIALLTAYEGALNHQDADAVILALRQRARNLGADALVGLQVVNRGGDVPRSGYSATAIRFENEGCRN